MGKVYSIVNLPEVNLLWGKVYSIVNLPGVNLQWGRFTLCSYSVVYFFLILLQL